MSAAQGSSILVLDDDLGTSRRSQGRENLRGVVFVTDEGLHDDSIEGRDAVLSELSRTGALVVRVEGIDVSARGRLADVIDDAIERALDARGAAAPGIGSQSDADAALSDQLFRARRVGASALVVSLASLRAAATARGALEAEDSATLRFWIGATCERPVVLVCAVTDRAIGVYAEATALQRLVESEAHARAGAVEVCCDTATPPTSAPPETATPTPTTPTIATPTRPLPEADLWRPWAQALATLRGPQPLASFEKLFAKSYLPLARAIAAGLDDPRAAAACEDFRRTFQNAYSGAFPTFGVTGKRPKMVLDVPDLAAKAARLHGARQVQLLLVDAMRWDLGQLVRDELVRALDGRATLTEELLLFSALPSITMRQLDGIGRGMESLRNPSPDSERELEPVRGRTAEMIRRVRVGSRELYKLDLATVRLREAGIVDALPALAAQIAEAIERHVSTLSPRTLLFVFGDHGFTTNEDGDVREGGAAPEEVMVPAFAWLTGEVH